MLVLADPTEAATPAANRVVAAVVIVGAEACVGAVGAVCAYTDHTNIPAISIASIFLIMIFSPVFRVI